MSLKLLVLEDEPQLEISYVTREGEEHKVDDLTDMELPGGFTIADDLNELDRTATALESLEEQMSFQQGIDKGMARQLDGLVPGFLLKVGGHQAFTSRPSLEGLADAAQSIQDKLTGIIAKIRTMMAEFFKRFLEWMKGLAARTQTTQIGQNLISFFQERRLREAMNFLGSLPNDPAEAAAEVASFAGGEVTVFEQALADQFQALEKKIEALQAKVEEDPARYRLVKGIVSVKDLFQEDADSAIRQVLEKAKRAAQAALSGNGDSVQRLKEMQAITAEIEAFTKDMVVSTDASAQHGDDRQVSLDKLYANVNQAIDDMQRVDVKQQIEQMQTEVEALVKLCEDTGFEEILSKLPEDVAEQDRRLMANTVRQFFKVTGLLGRDLLKLWQVRVAAVQSLNSVGADLAGLVKSFQDAVAQAGASLEDDQKEKLVTGLRKKGMVIVF